MAPEGAPESLRTSIAEGRRSVLAKLTRAVRPAIRSADAGDAELTASLLSAIADEYARLVLTDPDRYTPERLLRHASWWLDQPFATRLTEEKRRRPSPPHAAATRSTPPACGAEPTASPATRTARTRSCTCCARASSATATRLAVVEVGGEARHLRRALGPRGAGRRRPARRGRRARRPGRDPAPQRARLGARLLGRAARRRGRRAGEHALQGLRGRVRHRRLGRLVRVRRRCPTASRPPSRTSRPTTSRRSSTRAARPASRRAR